MSLTVHRVSVCGRFVRNGSTFVRMLAAGSIQMCSYVASSELPPLSAKLGPPLPPTIVNSAGKQDYASISLAAGEISMVAYEVYGIRTSENWRDDVTYYLLKVNQ